MILHIFWAAKSQPQLQKLTWRRRAAPSGRGPARSPRTSRLISTAARAEIFSQGDREIGSFCCSSRTRSRGACAGSVRHRPSRTPRNSRSRSPDLPVRKSRSHNVAMRRHGSFCKRVRIAETSVPSPGKTVRPRDFFTGDREIGRRAVCCSRITNARVDCAGSARDRAFRTPKISRSPDLPVKKSRSRVVARRRTAVLQGRLRRGSPRCDES